MSARRPSEYSTEAAAAAKEYDTARSALIHDFVSRLNDSATPKNIKVAKVAGTISMIRQLAKLADIADE